MTNKLAKSRGTFRHGERGERSGLLGTFLGTPLASIDSATYFASSEVAGAYYVTVRRSMWQTWSGVLTAELVKELRDIIGADKLYGAFADTPPLPF